MSKPGSWLVVTMTVILACGTALAQAPLPPGTAISPQNWQQFKDYMPPGMQAMFNGQYFEPLPNSPEYYRIVGPTSDIHLPKIYLNNTEKYASQVKLVPTPWGGFILENYVAGIPFPRPAGPNRGIKILFDEYYHYEPHETYVYSRGWCVDRFGNTAQAAGIEVYCALNHLSDPGLPNSDPDPGLAHYDFTQFGETVAPEESKYTTALEMVPSDLARVPELYVFLPSLRRSLRLSETAVCAPLSGTDITHEDERAGFNGQVALFSAQVVGEQKILTMLNLDGATYPNQQNYDITHLGAAKTNVGKWELRDAYVLDIRRVPEKAHGYCYSKRILYVDKNLFVPLWADMYDINGKLYKSYYDLRMPVPIPKTNGDVAILDAVNVISDTLDFQNRHYCFYINDQGAVNEDVPPRYKDLRTYTLPEGLDRVMQ
jgi:Protein of unknown function (DUF1329)